MWYRAHSGDERHPVAARSTQAWEQNSIDEGTGPRDAAVLVQEDGSDGLHRRFRIIVSTLHEYGYTDGCPGWRHLSSGMRGTRDHSKACLDRIVQQIEDDTSSVGTRWKERLRDEARRMRQHGAHEGKVH